MGIDQVLIEFFLSVGLSRCLTTFIQERGHNQHHGVYDVLTDWKLFTKLLNSITLPPKQVASDESYDHEYINSTTTAKTPDEITQQPKIVPHLNQKSFLLGVEGQRMLTIYGANGRLVR